MKRFLSTLLLTSLSLQTLGLPFAFANSKSNSSEGAPQTSPNIQLPAEDVEFGERSLGKSKPTQTAEAPQTNPNMQLPEEDKAFGERSSVKSKSAEPKGAPETAPNIELSPADKEYGERSIEGEKFTFKDIPRELGGSLKESFWGWGALGFGLGIGLTAGMHPLDDNIQNSFKPNAVFGKTANDVIGWTFSPYTIGGVSLITWIVAANTNHPKLALTTRTMTEALFLSLSLDAITKVAFRRQRPDGGNFGFPSAHATAAFTAAGVLTTFYGWKAALPSYAVASLVAVSRVDGYHHFVSDVLMGAVLGSVIGVGTARFQKKEHPNFFLTPSVSRNNASIGFTYIY